MQTKGVDVNMVTMKTEYWYVILGAVGMVAAAHYFPSLKKLGSLNNDGNNIRLLSIEQISGIDLNALSICRQKGLM